MELNLKLRLKKKLDHPAVWIFLIIMATSLFMTSYMIFIVDLPEKLEEQPVQEEPQEPISDITFSFNSYDVNESEDSVDIVMKVDTIREPQSATVAYYVGDEQTVIESVEEGDTFAIKANYGEKIRVGYIDQDDSFVGVESFTAV